MSEEPVTSAGSERVYRSLRRQILRLDLKPGAELDESLVSSRYEVSRTPVREALIRLTAEGLVTSVRGRGARVASLDLQDLRAFFEGLDILQRSVTRLAALRREQADIDRLEAHMLAFEAGAALVDSEVINEVNFAFHAAIAEAARSSFLSHSYQRSLVEGMRIGYVSFSEHSGLDQRLTTHLESTIQDHRDMFIAIRERDADAAEQLAGAHVELFRKRVATAILSSDVTQRISAASRHSG
jgi:DNA-binding GntR family transcriptional regulator